ncbi:hypothetical protein ACVA51_10670 [Pseudomonas luteola]
MKVINPLDITDAMLISSNVPENDYPAWSTSSSYTVASGSTAGSRVLDSHRIWEYIGASAGNTIASPSTDKSTPAKWAFVSYDNRWAMFDQVVGTQTVQEGTIDVTIRPNAIVNSVAFFGLQGTSVTVTMSDDVDGQVYNRTIQLTDTDVSDWYEYFFEPIGAGRQDFVLFDLPSYGAATLRIVVNSPNGTAKLGLAALGTLKTLGWANYGSSVGITDYSRKDVDNFGHYTIVERAFSKRADFDVTIDTSDVSMVQRFLAKIRTKPVVWIGSENMEATILYGFYKDFSEVISNPSISQCSISVEALV